VSSDATAPPRISRLEHLGNGTNVVTFDGPLNRPCYLQKTEVLASPEWQDIGYFGGSPVARILRATNAVPEGTNTVFYRL
jgi:hypothetical protein